MTNGFTDESNMLQFCLWMGQICFHSNYGNDYAFVWGLKSTEIVL